jgi:hypothetical protein
LPSPSLGRLGLVFLRYLPKLVRRLLVAGEVYVARAHQVEFERCFDKDPRPGRLNLCCFPDARGSSGKGKSWLPDSNNRRAKQQIGRLAIKRRSADHI